MRFAFWSAEELGLLGSYHYVLNLTPEEKNNTALNLNFDMIVGVCVYVYGVCVWCLCMCVYVCVWCVCLYVCVCMVCVCACMCVSCVCALCTHVWCVCGAFEKDNLIIGRYMISPVHQMAEYLHSLCGML